ncbi:MAG: hypothetical protein A3I26_03035 [Candidatus Yanofskybacteria bacterium RIFCSPLOWO2_02_FULL_43_10]|uniref:Uncharacterized protein n=2 Tax=Parcubacteria group TaxID=1794811 RepID=A0A1G2RPT6_9BACT|nr:MAG: hypothetical protein A2742_02080 [Candidatus Yanofskybacteria bacterium RIFCSPHIGHO2_01_FULL_43_32]OGN11795.1 MAG: hypothetical protein A3C69_00315 [Candidatus Yanofskybacteria bacterium RIFCSPHIGHO2_02_FULL_43_12]OGN18040.1 MAG: hypothetical protein A3E34_01050 [Candidatus Yanofskybacteria bacterium RIFCSPHIGHO2_12_FULL_43_11]OGN30080.1 MAG: hypothetical protein A3I26_03035 [Candidatus Yanofskybacteria bacterium RIFCSPLOWO2_02_FULL_43_10]OGN34411.1 MAG: hypothetical protein A3G51_03420
MSNTGNKKFGWFAIFVAFSIGFSLGDDSDKHKSEVRRLNSEISEKDSRIKQLEDENKKLKANSDNEASKNPYDPFRSLR